ncbi:MAG: DUF2887 domain-containing protein, partial [Synechococcaceae cyanobacterium RM1_1_27]|nr:DUF2887 domain-containing protein [Synechococcaceae cyanobacterium RM1_1_27]
FRLDGIFLPSVRDRPIYFVEVQFQRDPKFYYRFVAEMAMYLRQYQPAQPCRAVVLYPRESLDLGIPASLELLAAGIQRVYLNQLPETESPLVGIVKVILDPPQQARERVQELVNRGLEAGILELLETVLVYKFAELSREEIEAMFGLSELKQTRVYQEAREEGKLEGKQEGEVNLTLRLLRRKFSLEALPNKTEATIRSLPIEKLERLGEELLTFTSIENLISWLDQFAPDSP